MRSCAEETSFDNVPGCTRATVGRGNLALAIDSMSPTKFRAERLLSEPKMSKLCGPRVFGHRRATGGGGAGIGTLGTPT